VNNKEFTKEDIAELLKDEEILYLLEDLKKSKEYQADIKITLVLKKGKITGKEYTVRKFNNKNRAR
jgi:hypothetical protein